jgi:hypothetical protein
MTLDLPPISVDEYERRRQEYILASRERWRQARLTGTKRLDSPPRRQVPQPLVTNGVCEPMTIHQVAARRGVGLTTVRFWIKSGRWRYV